MFSGLMEAEASGLSHVGLAEQRRAPEESVEFGRAEAPLKGPVSGSEDQGLSKLKA